MFTKLLKQPFQYEKIDLSKVQGPKKKRAKNTAGTIQRISTYLFKEKWKLFLVILMVMISSGLGLLGPFLVGKAIDDFIVTQKTEGFIFLLISLVIVYTFYSVSIFLQNFWMIGIAQNIVFTLRKQLFEKFHQLPISFFDKSKLGELMSRVTNDIDNINNTLNQSVIQIFSSTITLFGTVTIMIILSPLLTAITMTIIPLLFICMRMITKRTGPLYKIQQADLGELNGYVEETISGQHIVTTYSQEKRVIREFDERNKQLQLSGYWSQAIAGFIPKVMNMLNFLSFFLIAFFGGILALKGHVTVGVIVIFIEYARQFTRPLNELSNQFNILLSAVAGAERVYTVLDKEEEEINENDKLEMDEIKGHFVFKDVSFSYAETPVLQHINFEVKPGQTIALVGHTGAGKSTLVQLISRFYDYRSGQIMLDGIELNKIKRSNLRQQMAFVLQDAFLFEGTVRDNIRYGKLDATEDEIIEAAKRANAHSFIERLPEGYDTKLDENGSMLSQGQKQLLTIARAMIAEPSILILDEATSNIDTITEIKIQEGLKRLMKNRTSFVIAHRLNTIQQADLIILLEDGKIVEKGNHTSLMKKRGKYYSLYSGHAILN